MILKPLTPAPFDRLTTPLSREGRGRRSRGKLLSITEK
jgi:hypothetical protein